MADAAERSKESQSQDTCLGGPYRLAVDIGGTFTDAVLIDESVGVMSIGKVLTTPADPSDGFFQSTHTLTEHIQVDRQRLPTIIHGTTVATNALLERKGAETAFLTTAGFRDILDIARQVRYELYNLQTEKPPPLVARHRCLEILERMDYEGRILCPLDEESVIRAACTLRDEGVRSVAICFLHAYRNGEHERRAADIIHDIYPDALVSLSSEIAPEVREYWRASTTVTNAYIRPIVQSYLTNIEQRLDDGGIEGTLHIMQSSAGMMSASLAKERPIYMLESGPAAGVAAAAFIAGIAGFPEAISFDMGGTTAKVGLIRGGRPSIRSEFEAGSVAGTGVGLARGSGYPILAPVTDLVEVGAGGGSLAWIDPGGLLRVGPRSAGADPGPACYGRGGTHPTVTDANLILGRLDGDHFLGGNLTLDVAAAEEAIDEHCARPLHLSVIEAASGIVDIANATMVQAMRLVSVQRGYDPRDFVLVAFGGAGPVHATGLADDLGIPTVVVPPAPGVASALGMLASNVRRDYRVTHMIHLADACPDAIETIFRELEERAALALADEGFTPQRISLQRSLDLRYVGQSWKLAVTLPDGALTPEGLNRLKQQFDRQHEEQYGYHVPEEAVEVVSLALSAQGLVPPLALQEVPRGEDSSAGAQMTMRPVFFRESGGYVETPIYDRYRLLHGNIIEGPAIVVEMDATTVIQPGYRGEVGPFGILSIQPAGGGMRSSENAKPLSI